MNRMLIATQRDLCAVMLLTIHLPWDYKDWQRQKGHRCFTKPHFTHVLCSLIKKKPRNPEQQPISRIQHRIFALILHTLRVHSIYYFYSSAAINSGFYLNFFHFYPFFSCFFTLILILTIPIEHTTFTFDEMSIPVRSPLFLLYATHT